MTKGTDKKHKPVIRRVHTQLEKIECANLLVQSEPWMTLGISYKQTMRTFNDSIYEVYGVFIKEEVVGTIVLQTKGAFSGYLKSIAVKDSYRGQHLGTLMMKFVEETVFSSAKNVFLCVSSFNIKAQKFYSKLGYKRVGELKNYIINGDDEILMRKTIGPINA